jgi:Holliday junction resolvase
VVSHMRANVTKRPGNKRYIAGRRAEYEARDLLISEGWPVVVRAAGSKGPADLVAVNVGAAGSPRVLFVSVKKGAGRATKAEREALRMLPAPAQIWTRQPRGVWVREEVA